MKDNLKLLKIIYWSYIGVVLAYCGYGLATEHGLYGFIVDLQLRYFQSASMRVTFFVMIIILFIPIIPLATYIRRKEQIAKQLNQGQQGGIAAPGPKKATQWMWVAVLGVAPFVISVGVYGYVMYVDASNQSRTIYQMDLSKSAALPAADAKFVELQSTLQQDYEYALEEKIATPTRNSYTPLTDSAWRPDQPVKYFLYLKSTGGSKLNIGHYNKQIGRYETPPKSGPYASTFDGQLSQGALPTYVKNDFERRSIKVAEPHYVLQWMGDFNGQIGSRAQSQMYYLIPVFGGFLSLLILVVGALNVRARNKLQSQR